MATHRHIDAVCVVITAFTLILTVLFMNGTALGIQAVSDEENSDAMFTQNDLSSDWDTSGATKITLSDEGSTVAGNGAYVNGGEVHIIYAGKYLLSGNLSDGSVIIEADGDDKIWLMFDGVTLHCEDSAALLVEQAEKVFITLKDGTENTLSSGSDFSEEAVSAGIDGTIYSRDDLTVNGEGALNITADYRHGIVCNDDLTITGGTITVTTAQDAIHANDSVRIKDADLTLNAGDDGITASNDDETSFIYIESGNISIPSCYEGLEAVQITIAGGTIDINRRRNKCQRISRELRYKHHGRRNHRPERKRQGFRRHRFKQGHLHQRREAVCQRRRERRELRYRLRKRVRRKMRDKRRNSNRLREQRHGRGV